MPTLSSLAKSLHGQIDGRTSDCCLIELDRNDSPVRGSSLVFQYYPDTIQDTKAVNYQQKEIFGGSLPLYQWVASGERLISFTATFTCDVDLLDGSSQLERTELYVRLKSAGHERRNIDIRSAILWLRQFQLPTYGNDENLAIQGKPLTFAPSKLLLSMPGTGIGLSGGEDRISGPNTILCIMTQCDVTYEALFASGLPRIATVQLAFAQVAQHRGGVTFPSRSSSFDANRRGDFVGGAEFLGYNLTPKGKP